MNPTPTYTVRLAPDSEASVKYYKALLGVPISEIVNRAVCEYCSKLGAIQRETDQLPGQIDFDGNVYE